MEAYSAFLADPENGFTQTQPSAGFTITVKYLPADYFASMELPKGAAGSISYDSLRAGYENSMSFHVVLAPASPQESLATLVHRNANSTEAVSEQVALLTYDMARYVRLTHQGKAIVPVLASLESTPGTDQKLSFLLVFDKQQVLEVLGATPSGNAVFSLEKNFFLDQDIAFIFPIQQLLNPPKLTL